MILRFRVCIDTIVYIDLRKKSHEDLATLIMQKLGRPMQVPSQIPF
jgi:hypothetical protein